ncbi:hypothetical protein [Actinomadura sp. NPDC048394]|jgi:hypothetical protein|uniref:hypothetical protein n=1 Tax=Actinomadura sp. NPDC048394 TaxID=3158223 RepID=UPI0033F4FF71
MREKDLDLRVHDRVALDEIELYAEVLSAAAAADGPLTAAEIDNVLGVRRGRPPKAGARPRTAVSAAQVYRQARRQAAAEQPSFDVRSGLEKLNQWMAGDSGEGGD